MLHLLPEQQKKLVLVEYHRRLGITICVFVMAIATMGVILLLPSYMVAKQRYDKVLDKKNVLQKQLDQISATDSSNAVKEVSEKIAALAPMGGNTDASTVFDLFNTFILNGIQVTRYHYVLNPDKTIAFSVEGNASTREVLVSFADAIDTSGRFSGAKVPLSSLRNGKNVPFNFKLGLKTLPKAVVSAAGSTTIATTTKK